jgi:F0F1-type ATP synthase membrane subunit c/vacuolar-type H+-ATPase subunit K
LYLDKADADLMKGKRILVVDDVISTGESLNAIEALVEKAGGNVVGRMAILAEGDATAATQAVAASASGLKYLSAALCTGVASIGGGMALAAGIPAAIGATSEDPKAFGKALIFVALGETLALYGVIISFMILNA